MKTISLRLSTLIVVLAIGLTQSASASNPVIDWNQIALTTALTTPGTQIYLTYVNLAMYDAVNAIDGQYQQYAPEFHGPRECFQGGSRNFGSLPRLAELLSRPSGGLASPI